jgi:hypothetical protein
MTELGSAGAGNVFEIKSDSGFISVVTFSHSRVIGAGERNA